MKEQRTTTSGPVLRSFPLPNGDRIVSLRESTLRAAVRAANTALKAERSESTRFDEVSEATPSYSRAFETLVREPEDIVGLLAYSLFKASIRERVRGGQEVPQHLRNPTAAETDAYRGQAERILERYAEGVIAEAEPGITAAARGTAKDEIITEVRNRTRAWPAIGYGVVAWFISIVITVVVVLASPGWVRDLVNHVTPVEQSNQR